MSDEQAEYQINDRLSFKEFLGLSSGDREENNNIKSKVRCLCEHVFGFITDSMNDFYINSIGFLRAKGTIGLINQLYNMCHYEQIVGLELLTIKKNYQKMQIVTYR